MYKQIISIDIIKAAFWNFINKKEEIQLSGTLIEIALVINLIILYLILVVYVLVIFRFISSYLVFMVKEIFFMKDIFFMGFFPSASFRILTLNQYHFALANHKSSFQHNPMTHKIQLLSSVSWNLQLTYYKTPYFNQFFNAFSHHHSQVHLFRIVLLTQTFFLMLKARS